MSLCTELSRVNASALEGEISALRCKKWDCDICRPYNRARVIRIARNGNPNIMLTLSVDHKRYETPDDAARDMKRGLVLLRRHIERRWNIKNIPFLVVFEKHQSGWPHMHILLRAKYLHRDTLIGMWKKIVGAWTVDIRAIKKRSHIWYYCTKYIGKDLQAVTGCKRWWRSQNYNEVHEEPWVPVMHTAYPLKTEKPLWRYRAILHAFNYIVEDIGAHRVRFRANQQQLEGKSPVVDFRAIL